MPFSVMANENLLEGGVANSPPVMELDDRKRGVVGLPNDDRRTDRDGNEAGIEPVVFPGFVTHARGSTSEQECPERRVEKIAPLDGAISSVPFHSQVDRLARRHQFLSMAPSIDQAPLRRTRHGVQANNARRDDSGSE